MNNLAEALHGQFDEYYASLPRVAFNTCLSSLVQSNEEPFFPGFDVAKGFAIEYRNHTVIIRLDQPPQLLNETGHYGAVHRNISELESKARYLSDTELNAPSTRRGFVY